MMNIDKLKTIDLNSIKLNKPVKGDGYYFASSTGDAFFIKKEVEVIEIKVVDKKIITCVKSSDIKLLRFLKDIEFHIVVESYKESEGWFGKTSSIDKLKDGFVSKIKYEGDDFHFDLEFDIDHVKHRYKTRVFDASNNKLSYKKINSGDLVNIAFKLDGVKFSKNNSTPLFVLKQLKLKTSVEDVRKIEDYDEYSGSDTESCKL